jgi:serine/threonine protein kinase/TolB-like protein/Tfp pilus assembly protein PilF
MTTDRWARLSNWHNAWLAADPVERERLRTRFAAEHPDLAADADELASASADLAGFLETPAFVLAAPELAKDPLLAANTMLGPYRVVAFLARGGTGDVYRATDVRLCRDVALKVLAPDTRGDGYPQRVERFLREARLTASLDHPNIVRLYDVGLFDGRPYFVAELLDGETLRTRIARGSLTIEEALRIGADVARGLVAAHAAGSVHRDLKPENIFLTRQGATKILDFGIAKLVIDDAARDGLSTLTGIVLGTAGYLAPEQIRGGDVDGRADLFALGAILSEMLTGRRAFAREHTVDTLHAILHEAPPDVLEQRHDVPPALAAVVGRLLEKSPGARVRSAADLVSALEEIARGGPHVDLASRDGVSISLKSPRITIDPGRGDRAPRTARSAVRVTVVLATLALAAVVAGWLYRRAPAPAPGSAAATVAIFPFRSLPDSAESQLLELGLADVLISRLSQLSDVRVLPLSATERVRSADPREAGRTLGADRVLTGTLQRERNRIRASVQLLSIPEDRAIWSGTFDADAVGAFSIQDAVVARVLLEIAPQLSPSARGRLIEPGTRNSEAYESYLRGRAHAAQITGADLARATESFRRAVTLDPGYADAWAALGAAYRRLPLAGEVDPKQAFPEAARAAGRARELSPDHPEALSVLGTVEFWYEWNYPRAEELLRRAVERQPSAAESRVFLAHLLSNLGRHDEALVEVRQARSLDPNLPIARSLEGQFLVMARRYDEALVQLDSAVELAPRFVQGHVMRAYPLIALRRYDEAIRECDIARELEDRIPRFGPVGARVFPSALRAYALARAGRRAEAEAALERIRRQERETRVRPIHVALVLHGLGRDGEALDELSRAVDGRDPAVTFLGVDPKWDGLRTSPSFQELLSRVNLLEVSNRVLASRVP